MRIEPAVAKSFTIFDVPNLDPVTVVIQDFGAGSGRILIECFGRAWSAYWGSMGPHRIAEFVAYCSPDYIVNRLLQSVKQTATQRKSDERYLKQITTVVQSALRKQTTITCQRCKGSGWANAARDAGMEDMPAMLKPIGVYQCPDCGGNGKPPGSLFDDMPQDLKTQLTDLRGLLIPAKDII